MRSWIISSSLCELLSSCYSFEFEQASSSEFSSFSWIMLYWRFKNWFLSCKPWLICLEIFGWEIYIFYSSCFLNSSGLSLSQKETSESETTPWFPALWKRPWNNWTWGFKEDPSIESEELDTTCWGLWGELDIFETMLCIRSMLFWFSIFCICYISISLYLASSACFS